MTTFLKVEDQIQELSKGHIQKRKIPPLISVILILIGIPFLWFGGRDAFLEIAASYYLTIFGVIFIVGALLLHLLPGEYFYLAAPRGIIKPRKVNLDSTRKEAIGKLFAKGQIREILKNAITEPSPFYIELWWRDGYDTVFVQLYEDVDTLKRPFTPVATCSLNEIKH